MAQAPEIKGLLDLRPVRLMEHRMEGELAVVLVPRFRSRWMFWLQRRLKKPHFHLHLDPIGTAVWLFSDGESTVSRIGERLLEKFGDEVEPVWDRLALFIRHMNSGKLIDLQG